MTRTPALPDRVAVNVRAEMAAQRRSAVQLASLLAIGHRAALRRVNGEMPFSLGELDKVAAWLDVSVSSLMAARSTEQIAQVAS